MDGPFKCCPEGHEGHDGRDIEPNEWTDKQIVAAIRGWLEGWDDSRIDDRTPLFRLAREAADRIEKLSLHNFIVNTVVRNITDGLAGAPVGRSDL